MVTEQFPYPPTDGVRLKIYHMLKGLSKQHKIILLSFTESLDVDNSGIRSYCEHIELIPRVPRKHLHIKAVLNIFEKKPFSLKVFDSDQMRNKIHAFLSTDHIDIVHLDMPNTAQFYELVSHMPTFMAPHDSMTLNLSTVVRREKNLLTKFYRYMQLRKWREYEKTMYAKFNKCFVVSDIDKQVLLSLNPKIDITVAPNGVDVDFFKPLNLANEYPSLVFSGSMGSFQSYDAILYFYNEIYVHIKKKIPDIRLYIVGKNPPDSVRALSKDSSVTVTGFVEDVRPYIDKSTVYICPIMCGSGIKNRLLEAMAMKKPIVASRKSCEALKVKHMEHLLLADNPQEFMNGIFELLEKEELRQEIANNARKLVEKEYSWETTIDIIENAYKDAINKKMKC